MDPAGAITLNQSSDEYQKIQFQIQSHGKSTAFKVDSVFSLRTPRHADQFNKQCNDQRYCTAYLDVDEYMSANRVQIEQLFGSGFDSLEVFDGLQLNSNCYNILMQLKEASVKFPNQKYVSYVLECSVCTGVPMIVENVPEQLQTFTKSNLPSSYDCFAIVNKNATQIQKQQILHQDIEVFDVQFKLFQKYRILPSKLLIISYDPRRTDERQMCQICVHCVAKGITRHQYFNVQADVQTSKQLAFRPNHAEVYCKNDDMSLCRECDQLLHVQLLANHQRTDVNLQTKFSKCQIHPDQVQKFYDHINKKFFCQKCLQSENIQQLTKNSQNIINVEEVYFDIQQNFDQKISISDQQKLINNYQQQYNKLLNQVDSFSQTVEQVVIKYFKQVISQLQLNTQLFVQQILSQDVIVSNYYKQLSNYQQFIKQQNQQQQITTNEQILNYNYYKSLQQDVNNQLVNDQLFIQQFSQAFQKQIQNFQECYTIQPQQHLEQICQELSQYQNSRLYGLYSRVPKAELVFLGSDQGNTQMQNLIMRQLINEKLQQSNQQELPGEFDEKMTARIFNQINQNDKLFAFNLQEQPIYSALQKNALLQKEKENNEKILQEQQRILEDTKRKQELDEEIDRERQLRKLELDKAQPNQQTNSMLSQNLNTVQKQQLFESVYNNVKLGNTDNRNYLDEIFNDAERQTTQIISNVVNQSNINPFNYQNNTVTPANQLFNQSIKNVQRRDDLWTDQNNNQTAPTVTQGQEAVPVQQQQKTQDPDPNLQLSNPNLINTQTQNVIQQQQQQQQQSENYQQQQDQFTQNQISQQQKQITLTTIQQNYQVLVKTYKLDKKNVELPFMSTLFQEATIHDKQMKQQVLFQSLHNYCKQQQFPKLKLLEPQLVDLNDSLKFAKIMFEFKKEQIDLPALLFIEINNRINQKCICLFEPEAFGNATYSNPYSFVCDLETGSINMGKQLEIGDKKWIYDGGYLEILKDFKDLKYEGQVWVVQRVVAYTYRLALE